MSKLHSVKLLSAIAVSLLLTACGHFFPLRQEPLTPPPLVQEQPAPKPAPVAAPQEQKKTRTYQEADRSPPRYMELKEKCVEVNGQSICGYDCKVVDGHAKCATEPKQRCIVGNNGDIACGYDCKKTATEVRCAKHLYHNCVSNERGEIVCGNNCYEREDGELICGK